MKARIINYPAAAVLMLCLVHSASAQDSHWNGTANNTAWNVATNWNPVGVPPSGSTNAAFAGNVWLDPANGDTVITVPPGDVETPGVGNDNTTRTIYNTIFGPEFGCTLNIYGELSWDWTMAPYQPDPTPGLRSHINLYGNAYAHTSGASLNLGSGWWPVCEGTYVTMNLYSNANYSSLGGAGLWSGGHINIYDQATFLVNGYVNLNNGQANNDGTTDFNLGGGTMKLPLGFINTTVTNWITRGILRAYGKGYDTNDLVITDNGTNTIITPVPLGGALQRVYFQPLVQPTVHVGDFQQVTLVGDYPSVSGVLLSSDEPGLSPGSFPQPVYTSSNPSVAAVNTDGLVTAVGIGSATLTATVGAFNSTNSVTITVAPVVPGLAHEYSFTADASDSVGGMDGTANGTVSFSGGQAVFDGNLGSSITLPGGILSGVSEVTIEVWVTFPSAIITNANLFAFGDQNSTTGNGRNYITFSPHTSALNTTATFGQGDPGSSGERNAVAAGVLDNQTNVHIVAVYHPHAGFEAVYINGAQVARNSMFNVLMDPVASQTPAFNGGGILAYTLGADPINYIGQSLYAANPNLLANVDEFRIYTNALTAAQIRADTALGPNKFIGTSTNVSLTAKDSGGNVAVEWPTTSALVNLQSSPVLGPGAVWTSVTNTVTLNGANFHVPIPPVPGVARFYRLSN